MSAPGPECQVSAMPRIGRSWGAKPTSTGQRRGKDGDPYWCEAAAVQSTCSITFSRMPEARSGHQRPPLNARQTPKRSEGTKRPMGDRKQRQAQHRSFLFARICLNVWRSSLREGGGHLGTQRTSLLSRNVSLFSAPNSLFDYLGKVVEKRRSTERSIAMRTPQRPSSRKFPCIFPC
jgi:hypothetical protein